MKSLLLIDNYTNLISVTGVYLRNPKTLDFNTNCELPVHLHDEIVRLAASMFLSDRFKIPQTENKNDSTGNAT